MNNTQKVVATFLAGAATGILTTILLVTSEKNCYKELPKMISPRKIKKAPRGELSRRKFKEQALF